VATELRIDESRAADVLESLASDNLLDVRISNEVLYRFNPSTSELDQAAARCADYYLRERIAMINAVLSARLGAIREFAEAFRVTKTGTGKKNG
jgi:hypothetical protein